MSHKNQIIEIISKYSSKPETIYGLTKVRSKPNKENDFNQDLSIIQDLINSYKDSEKYQPFVKEMENLYSAIKEEIYV
jgi:hypothetical protein